MSVQLGTPIYDTCVKLLKKNRYVHNRTIIIDLEIIPSIIKILTIAKMYNYYVFVLSNRPPSDWRYIIDALDKQKITFTSVFTSSYVDEHPIVKIDIRDRLKLIDPSLFDKNKNTIDLLIASNLNKTQIHHTTSIVLCVGDSWLDILGDGDFFGIKLPSSNDNHIYLYNSDKKINCLGSTK